MSSDQGFADGQRDFYHADSADAEMNEYYAQNHSSEIGPADQLQVEENVVDQLNYHLDAPSYKGASFTKKSRKAKQTYHDEDLSFSTRKKYSKEELKERQAQLLAVTDVSRRLDGICAAHALSVAERNQERGGGRGKGRGRPGSEPATVPGQAVPVFGLDKPHDHYYGAGKCDLFTYDCDDGFVIDVDDCGGGGGRERRDSVVARGKGRGGAASRELREAPTAAAATPPSPCPLVNQSLVQACMEGKLVSSVSIFERTLASAVLSFCLSTHPRDPYLAKKISAHLKKGPMLAREFEMYCEAMAPGVHKDGGHGRGPSEDLKRDWKMFSSNLIDRVVLAHRNRDRLTAAENEAIGRCAASWSWSH